MRSANLTVFGYLLRIKVAVIVDYRHLGRMIMVKALSQYPIEVKIAVKNVFISNDKFKDENMVGQRNGFLLRVHC